ncbi:AMP-binding protein, partial [Klebsiella pneumoniae]|uniref:AMP-binding protein n=1 Tax=Klebsiella pneumoniae TaxID=573 RepID=UPI0025548434
MEKPWLALYPQQVPHSIDYPRKPLQQFLQEAAEQFPHKTAIHFLGKELTYNEVYEQALKLASYLQQLGLEKGDRVSIMLPNCPQAVISYYAVLFAGG